LHSKYSALAGQGPERKQLKKFLHYSEYMYIFMRGASSGTLAELVAVRAVTCGAIQQPVVFSTGTKMLLLTENKNNPKK